MDNIDVITRASERVREVLSTADPADPVPTCPEWDVFALAQHLAQVHGFWAQILERGLVSDEQVEELEGSEAHQTSETETLPEALERLRTATSALTAQLAVLEDQEPRWSWWPRDQSVGFTRRMQTYEATMHRVDAELAAGLSPSPLAPEVASGAVDHAVDVMWGWVPANGTAHLPHLVALEARDTGERWLVRVGEWRAISVSSGEEVSGPIARRGDADEPDDDAAATSEVPVAVAVGSVEDLALWAWGRGGEVEVVGEPEGVAALAALISAGIQ